MEVLSRAQIQNEPSSWPFLNRIESRICCAIHLYSLPPVRAIVPKLPSSPTELHPTHECHSSMPEAPLLPISTATAPLSPLTVPVRGLRTAAPLSCTLSTVRSLRVHYRARLRDRFEPLHALGKQSKNLCESKALQERYPGQRNHKSLSQSLSWLSWVCVYHW